MQNTRASSSGFEAKNMVAKDVYELRLALKTKTKSSSTNCETYFGDYRYECDGSMENSRDIGTVPYTTKAPYANI